MLSFFLALERKIEPNPLWEGLPTQTIVTIANFAETSAAMIAPKANNGLTQKQPHKRRKLHN